MLSGLQVALPRKLTRWLEDQTMDVLREARTLLSSRWRNRGLGMKRDWRWLQDSISALRWVQSLDFGGKRIESSRMLAATHLTPTDTLDQISTSTESSQSNREECPAMAFQHGYYDHAGMSSAPTAY